MDSVCVGLGGAHDSAFLTRLWVRPKLLVEGPLFENQGARMTPFASCRQWFITAENRCECDPVVSVYVYFLKSHSKCVEKLARG